MRQLKHLSSARKRQHSASSGERTPSSPNPRLGVGVGGSDSNRAVRSGTVWEGRRHRVTVPYRPRRARVRYLSTAGHVESGGKQGRPRPKAKYSQRAIGQQYREGTVKRTPARGVKESLKPDAYRRSEGVMADP